VRPGFEPTDPEIEAIASIASLVDGLPLALELAAARTRLFGPVEILGRLRRSFDLLSAGARDVPERQRTLRATVAWSHDLLAPTEQVIFRRLAVLVGSWTVDAAQRIVDPEGSLDLDLLDGLASLVDKSLLRTVATDDGQTRFARHVFVREYADEMLTASGERAACERRHAEAFRDLAVATGPHLPETSSQRYLLELDGAIHDLRAAITWSLETGDVAIGMEILGATWRWWQIRSHLAEGRDWVSRLLAHPASAGDQVARMGALAALGGLAYWSSDRPAIRAAYEERLAIAERLGDRAQLAEAHYDYGFVGMVEQDPELLRSESEGALALFEEIGNMAGIVKTRQVLVLAHLLSGEFDAAQELEERNLADFERTQSWYRIADSRMLLGAILWRKGKFAEALASARTAVRTLPELVGGSTIAALAVIALAQADLGEVELATRLIGAVRAIQAATGEALAPVQVLHLPDPEDVVRARLEPARAEELLAEGRAMEVAQVRLLALGEVAAEAAAEA
jgi:non-specific serine/threonine protein kinase